MRHAFHLLSYASLGAILTSPALAATNNYNIPAQPLSSAVQQFAKQGDQEVIYKPQTVRGKHSKGATGTLEAEEALRRILEGSNLGYRRAGETFVIAAQHIQPKSQQFSPAPVTRAAEAPPPPPAPSATIAGLEDIVVTAQKREESLQDTPISIAVLTASTLENQGIKGLGDFVNGTIPSLRIVPVNGRPSSLTVTMRGINPGEVAQISRDPTIGMYVDGVYLGRSQGLNTEMLDVERIEVLRGPQGTLFGRNAVGGAVSIVSKKPTGQFGADLLMGASNFNGFNIKGNVNLPEFAGISIKLEGTWSERDGWVNNKLDGQSDWYEYARSGFRATALWRPLDGLDIQYSFDKSRDESTGGYQQMSQFLTGASLPPLFPLEDSRVREGRVGIPLIPSIGQVQGHSVHLNWDINDSLILRSISAYREMSQTQYDSSGGLLGAFQPNSNFARSSQTAVDQDQLSQELQLIGSYDRLKFVLGAFYFEEDATDSSYSPFNARFNATGTDYVILIPPVGGTFPDRASKVNASSKALFGQATYTPPILDDRLHLTAGLRATHDKKNGGLTKLRGVNTTLEYEFESKRLDPAATIAFDWTDEINSYLRWGTAYRAGGSNSRSATFRPFNEEAVSTWELGLKTEFLDRRARLNVAAFHTRYKDRQVDFLNPANPSNMETLNAPNATTIKGMEVDFTLIPTRGLTINAAYAFTDWEASVDVNPFTNVIQRGAVAFTPKHSASSSINYQFEPFSFGTLSAHVDGVYSSSFYTGGAVHPKTSGYTMLNGRLTLGDIDLGKTGSKLAISLWGKNLTKEQWETYQFSFSGAGTPNIIYAHFNEPRTYGIEARLKY